MQLPFQFNLILLLSDKGEPSDSIGCLVEAGADRTETYIITACQI